LPGSALCIYKENIMIHVAMNDEIAAKLRTLVADQGDDAVVRVREAKVGAG